jgi:hypothetical protein
MVFLQRMVRWSALLALALVFTGCASPGLDKNAKTLDLSKESILVFSMDFTNTFKPGTSWNNLGVSIASVDPKNANTRNTELSSIGTFNAESGLALVSRQLPPGTYTIKTLAGSVRSAIFFGAMNFSVDAQFDVPPNAVMYAGHISIFNKERLDKDDQASGFAIPLIDQSVTGLSGGTLDVKLEDRYDKTVELLKTEYPALRNVPVLRAPLASMALARRSGSAPKIVKQAEIQQPSAPTPAAPLASTNAVPAAPVSAPAPAQ